MSETFGKVGAYFIITGFTGFVCGGALGIVGGCMRYKRDYNKNMDFLDKSCLLAESLFWGTMFGFAFGTIIGITAPVSVPMLAYTTLKNKD